MKRSLAALAVLVPIIAWAYAQFVASDWLEVSHLEIATGKWPRSRHLKVAVIGDLRATRNTRTLNRLEKKVREEQPDILIFAGGALGDASALDFFRKEMGTLYTPIARYAVRGNGDREPQLFSGGPATELIGLPSVQLEGALAVCGVPFGGEGSPCLEKAPSEAFVIFVSSTPDSVESLFPRPDLYVTSEADKALSRYAEKYAPGRYDVNGTVLSVTRSLWQRGFTRPEVTFIDIDGTN